MGLFFGSSERFCLLSMIRHAARENIRASFGCTLGTHSFCERMRRPMIMQASVSSREPALRARGRLRDCVRFPRLCFAVYAAGCDGQTKVDTLDASLHCVAPRVTTPNTLERPLTVIHSEASCCVQSTRRQQIHSEPFRLQTTMHELATLTVYPAHVANKKSQRHRASEQRAHGVQILVIRHLVVHTAHVFNRRDGTSVFVHTALRLECLETQAARVLKPPLGTCVHHGLPRAVRQMNRQRLPHTS